FSVNEICESDIRRRIKHMLIEDAVHYGLLANPEKEIMDVVTRKYSADVYQEIGQKIRMGHGVKDMRFWLINIAIRLQVALLKYKRIKGCVLVVRPERSSRSSNAIIIAKCHGFNMNLLVRFLIKMSFLFEDDNNQTNVGLSMVLVSFVGPANDALRENDAREFSNAVENLALWHAEVAQALSFTNNDGGLDNWLLLPAGGVWGRSTLDEMLREYYRL